MRQIKHEAADATDAKLGIGTLPRCWEGAVKVTELSDCGPWSEVQ
jgi:hypothetical protein